MTLLIPADLEEWKVCYLPFVPGKLAANCAQKQLCEAFPILPNRLLNEEWR